MKDVLTIIMAGGRGTRLMPLTEDRSKPAVPFGGIYRLIDIPLSNCINSQLYKILIFPQYKSQSLVDHLEEGWNIFSGDLGHYLRIVAPQQRTGEEWYGGTADSVRQNLYLIKREMPRYVLILSGDHVYKMDYAAFRDYHEKVDADVTVALLEVDRVTRLRVRDCRSGQRFQNPRMAGKAQGPKAYSGRPGAVPRFHGDLSVQDRPAARHACTRRTMTISEET